MKKSLGFLLLGGSALALLLISSRKTAPASQPVSQGIPYVTQNANGFPIFQRTIPLAVIHGGYPGIPI